MITEWAEARIASTRRKRRLGDGMVRPVRAAFTRRFELMKRILRACRTPSQAAARCVIPAAARASASDFPATSADRSRYAISA